MPQVKTLVINQKTINEKAKKYKIHPKYLESLLESAEFKKSNENWIFRVELSYKFFSYYIDDPYDEYKPQLFCLGDIMDDILNDNSINDLEIIDEYDIYEAFEELIDPFNFFCWLDDCLQIEPELLMKYI